jgi:hypothetical protein
MIVLRFSQRQSARLQKLYRAATANGSGRPNRGAPFGVKRWA